MEETPTADELLAERLAEIESRARVLARDVFALASDLVSNPRVSKDDFLVLGAGAADCVAVADQLDLIRESIERKELS